MTRINGLSHSPLPLSKARHEAKPENFEHTANRTAVAKVVSQQLRVVPEETIQQAKIEYDLPEGDNRQALEQYHQVFTQARREELAQLMGVDIYI